MGDRERDIEEIKTDFLDGLAFIDAVARLEDLGIEPTEAEEMVQSWEDNR